MLIIPRQRGFHYTPADVRKIPAVHFGVLLFLAPKVRVFQFVSCIVVHLVESFEVTRFAVNDG